MPDLSFLQAYLTVHPLISFAIAAAVLYGGPLLVKKVPWLGPIVAAVSTWFANLSKPAPAPAPVSPDAPPGPAIPSLSPLLAALLEAAKHAITTNQPQLLGKVSDLLAEAHSAEQGGAR